MMGSKLLQWTLDYHDWRGFGEELNAREETNDVPDPDEYADYDDEAARLVIEAAALLDVEAM